MNAIEFDHVGKQYRLGLVSTGTFSDDLTRWWTMHVRHKEDPFLKIGETNDRSHKGSSNFVWALKDINFNVEQGDVVGIIGKNGAGKSTLLKLLSRVTTPTVGEIRARGRIASLLEVGTGFHPEMTGRENIYLNGAIMGMTKQEITRKLDEIVDFSGCERYIDTPVKRYSSGMTVRLGFAIAAHLEPEILVVDEVLAVGDAEFQKKAIGKMQDVSKGEGRTVLFVSHNMDSMLNLCQKGVLLENGSVKYMGDIRSTVSEYLGGDNDNKFTQKNPQSPLFVSTVFFTGTHENQSGLFNFDEDITFTVVIKKDVDLKVDKNAVMSVILMTANRTRICNYEMPIGDMQESERTIQFRYKSKTLLPNTYLIRVVMHIPNVQFYDRQDTCSFKVSDNGTEFLKYNGTDNGLIIYTPDVNM
jgi:ABC-type polysaccharide/polyol phosphate transport system ATPase subunit